MAIVLVTCALLGPFLDGLAMPVPTLPIAFPTIEEPGFSLIWFDVVLG